MRAMLAGAIVLAMAAISLAQPRTAQAAAADPAQRDAALAVYQAFNKAVLAGKLNDALALRTTAMRARIAADAKTRAQQRQVLEMLRSVIPETLEVVHAAQSRDGSRMTLHTVFGTTVPPGPQRQGMPKPGTKLQAELTLEFLREGGAWRYDNQTFGMDPAQGKPCTSTGFPGMAAFEERENLTIGGQIRRVIFGPDHTLVVIRMLDEENCIYLPTKARLDELGFKTDLLAPWSIIEIGAWPHRTDKQSVWADTLGIAEPE